MIKKVIIISSLFLFIIFNPIESIASDATDSIGMIISTQGNVYATNTAGIKRSLSRRSEFYLHETIITKENSKTQLRFKDDTIVSLKPNTKYSVSAFNVDVKNPKNNKYIGNLVEGALISLSGQGEHGDSKIQTPIVTIAIRGTFFGTASKTIGTTTVGYTSTFSGVTAIMDTKGTVVAELDGGNPQTNSISYSGKSNAGAGAGAGVSAGPQTSAGNAQASFSAAVSALVTASGGSAAQASPTNTPSPSPSSSSSSSSATAALTTVIAGASNSMTTSVSDAKAQATAATAIQEIVIKNPACSIRGL
ncbi:MAG: hypothetical protein ACD_20C00001G0002 [uncultured bacterium]|nr:MAG: hypothetical protein ACD_20C00001G0002 [uncultured bacterium]